MAGFPDANADRYAREHYPGTDWGGTLVSAINDSQSGNAQSEPARKKGASASPAMAAQGDKVRKSRGVAASILSQRSGLASQASGADTLG